MTPEDDLLIQRYIAGELEPHERASLAERLRTDAEFSAEALDDIHNANLVGSALRAPPVAAVAQAVHHALALTQPERRQNLFSQVLGEVRHHQRMRWISRISAVAAALCGVLISWWIWQTTGSIDGGSTRVAGPELIEADVDRSVPLADGSHLYVTAGSRVLIERDVSGVLCRLERGGLSAEVTPQTAGRSVRVQTSHALVQVIGTRFSVLLGENTQVVVDKGLVRVQQADGAQCYVAAGFRLESTGRGPVIPTGSGTMLTDAPRLGSTAPSGHDPLANELFTLSATKQRHWISLDVPRSTVSWRWSDDFYTQAAQRKIATLQNTFFWSDIVRDDMDPTDARRAVDDWLSAFSDRYGTRLNLWEVVDDPLTSVPPYGAVLGGAGASGWDWLIWLHQRARQHAPTTPLLLGGFQDLASAEAVERFATVGSLLHDRGLLDGLVVKAHDLQSLDPQVLKNHLDRLARVGVPLYLCEVDIDVANDQAHAAAFARIFPVLWEHPAVRAVVFWGVRQGSCFRAHDYLITSTGAERPAVAWLRHYLEQDVIRVDLPLSSPAPEATSMPLVLRSGFAGHAITRVEVERDGHVIATPVHLPALVDLPRAQASGHTVVVRAYVGERQVVEVTRRLSPDGPALP